MYSVYYPGTVTQIVLSTSKSAWNIARIWLEIKKSIEKRAKRLISDGFFVKAKLQSLEYRSKTDCL